MLPRLEPEERLTRSDRWIVVGIGSVIFGSFLLDVLVNFGWLKAGALVTFVAWFALIVLHEVGHAVTASLLGWKVCRFVIGMGKPMLRFRAAGVPVQVCRYPVGGHVVPAPTSLRGARWKSSLIFLAGPAAELMVVAVLVFVFGAERLLGNPDDFVVLCAQAVAFAALLGVVLNLIPLTTRDGSATDGLGVLVSPMLPREVFQEKQALPYTVAAESLLLSGQHEHAIDRLSVGADALSDNLPAQVAIATWLLEANAPRAVVDRLDPLIRRSDVPQVLQPRILALVARALVRVDPERLEDADAYSKHALDEAPRSSTVKLARARVLLERGLVHPALTLAEQVPEATPDERILDERDSLLGLIQLRRGQVELARDWVRRLEARGARGAELDLLRQQLGIVPRQPSKYA